MKRIAAIACVVWCGIPSHAAADVNSSATGGALQITVPADGDAYSKLVARAVAQDRAVDFRALRFAYLKSAARKNAKGDTDALRTALFAAAKAGDDRKVRDTAVELLSMDYIDMYGHKFLRQSCARLHDDGCAAQGEFVEMGLLKSIIATGDGKTCKTGWEVVTVAEEYFIIDMMDDTLRQQSLIQGNEGNCDLLKVVDEDGKPQDRYFRIDAVLADEAAMLGLP